MRFAYLISDKRTLEKPTDRREIYQTWRVRTHATAISFKVRRTNVKVSVKRLSTIKELHGKPHIVLFAVIVRRSIQV